MLCFSNGTSNDTVDHEEQSDDSAVLLDLFGANFEESVESTSEYNISDPSSNDPNEFNANESFDKSGFSAAESSSMSFLSQSKSACGNLFIILCVCVLLVNNANFLVGRVLG